MTDTLFDLTEYTVEVETHEVDFTPAGGNLWFAGCSKVDALRELVDSEAQWLGNNLVVERRYVEPLAVALYQRGWTVRIEGESFETEEN